MIGYCFNYCKNKDLSVKQIQAVAERFGTAMRRCVYRCVTRVPRPLGDGITITHAATRSALHSGNGEDDPELEAAERGYRRLYRQHEAEIVAANAAGNLLDPNHPVPMAWRHFQDLMNDRRADGRWPTVIDQQTLRIEEVRR